MNSINRLEGAWTPQWDLGLQEEFGFLADDTANAEELERPSERPAGWVMASREVLNRQNCGERRIDCGASSIGDLVTFFETLAEKGTR